MDRCKASLQETSFSSETALSLLGGMDSSAIRLTSDIPTRQLKRLTETPARIRLFRNSCPVIVKHSNILVITSLV
jgi:hypothetical protein